MNIVVRKTQYVFLFVRWQMQIWKKLRGEYEAVIFMTFLPS